MSFKSALKQLFLDDIFSRQKTIERESNLSVANLDSEIPSKPNINAVHGTVSISEGKVLVTDPKNDGSYATVIVPDNEMVRVFVNGERVQGEVVVTQSSEIDIKCSSVEPSVLHDVIVSDDALSVSVNVSVVIGAELCLKDSIPSRHLKLVVEETHLYPPPASPQVILDLLAKNGYSGTIDYPAVNRLCNVHGSQQEVVLRGIAPKPGRPSRLRLSASVVAEHAPVFCTVKYRRVSIGHTCAVLDPESTGMPGVNVYGLPILPSSPPKKLPNVGDGVIVVGDNIVAVREGRLTFRKHLIDVMPEMVFESDVSAVNGEIQFNGNITICGSIRKGATVRATGTVTVYGGIETSSVFSGQGVFVREGIHGSNVVSGHQQILYEDLTPLLNRMIPELKRFRDEYALMVVHAKKRFDARITIPKIPAILFEKRHQNLEKMFERFSHTYSNELGEIDKSYRELKELVETTWTCDRGYKVTQHDSEVILNKFMEFNEKIKFSQNQLPTVKATHVTSSTIRSVGNIIIERSCYSSTLESGNTVSVQKTLVGGFVTARKSIYVNELGNLSGVETSVRVTEPLGFIRVKLNHINTLFEIAGRRRRTYNTERDIRYGGVSHD
ncbi:FapA family protein [Alicyclobacillus mengziensis]|uniref:DUF342 domain-containing protein n=1 Tax=Alicyclobacillus mengziensis TaxID=2931921 RepID=A0A9X7W091_9BACL|nr:FapA family protein [Alicyclobacillus mengziensis]QSO48358.1 DUF342 domain-containing protein [Alicyclobacillus mengziensis]